MLARNTAKRKKLIKIVIKKDEWRDLLRKIQKGHNAPNERVNRRKHTLKFH